MTPNSATFLAAWPVALVTRVTIILTTTWLCEAALRGCNPRWRILAWRAAAIGIVVAAALSFWPSAITLRVLPPPTPHTTLAEIPTNEPVPLPTDSSAPLVGQVMPQKVQQTAERSSGGSTTNAGAAASPANRSAEPAGSVLDKGFSPMPLGMAQSPDALRLPSPTTWLLVTWIIGCGLVLARFAIGAVRVARLARRATDVPAQLAAEATAVAGRLGVVRRLQVRQSRDINTPCSMVVLRTLVLLPADLDEHASRADVRAVLAHEIAHIAGNDLP